MTASPRTKARRPAARGLDLRASRRRPSGPLPTAHFRVFLGQEEVGIQSITTLHWIAGEHPDPELHQTVTLRRAMATDRKLFAWRASVAEGKGHVRDVVIAQLGEPEGQPINIWVLEKAVPVRWSGPELDALSGEIAYEELELRYESIAWRTRV